MGKKSTTQLVKLLRSSPIPSKVLPNLAQSEVSFFNSYLALLRKYNKKFDSEFFTMDLSDDLEHPPSDLYVEVRVVKHLGEVYTEDGLVNLMEGTQHTMRRVDAEQYIRQGALEHKTDHE